MSQASHQATQVGLTTYNCNYLKCWFTLIHDGKGVLQQIFEWGFGRSPHEIKSTLFQEENYTNSRYRSTFNAAQRLAIEAGDLNKFDINLLYLLLQRICSLPLPSHTDWSLDGNLNSLPNLLYRIKMKRNALAHTNLEISDIDTLALLDELKLLFTNALDMANVVYDVPENTLTKAKEDITLHILSLQSSGFAFSQKAMREIAEEKAAFALNEAQVDLNTTYIPFLKVLLAPWTIAETFRNIKDVFTVPVIKQTKSEILFQQLTEEDSVLEVENILLSKLPDDTLPNLILILSPSGMGKTTLVKYLIQSWMEKDGVIKGLDRFDLVLYMDCRVSRTGSVDELLSCLLPNTAKLFDKRELKALITTMQVLVVMDNIDEITERALPTFEELLQLNSDNFRILATSTQQLPRSMSRKYRQKYLKLQLDGISISNYTTCVSKMYDFLSEPESVKTRREEVDMFVSEYISQTSSISDDSIRSPEILSHVFFHWLLQSKKNVSYTTKTHLFLTTHELLCLKLMEKYGTKTQTSVFEQKIFYDKLTCFFNELFRIAFQTFESNQVIMETTIFREVVEICLKLNLPPAILREIFVIRERNSNFTLGNYEFVTFPSTSLHTFYCAMHIANMITEANFDVNLIGDGIFKTAIKRNIFVLLITFIIGILASNNIPKLEENINSIFHQIVKYTENVTTAIWLRICEEAKCHPTVMLKAKIHMGESWSVEDHDICAGLITMLQYHRPCHISLTVCKPPKDIYFLKKVLYICSRLQNLSVSLHLYYHFWVEKNQLSDNFLEILLKDNNKITIDSLAGNMSSKFLLKVPVSVRRLALHVKPEHISILNSTLPRLMDLVMLYLNFNITFDFPSKYVPKLKLPNANILLNVDLWNVDGERVEWACEVISCLSFAYSHLALRKTSLNYDAAKCLMEGLRSRRVHIDTFVLGTTRVFLKEEEESLAELANSFECSNVKLIYL